MPIRSTVIDWDRSWLIGHNNTTYRWLYVKKSSPALCLSFQCQSAMPVRSFLDAHGCNGKMLRSAINSPREVTKKYYAFSLEWPLALAVDTTSNIVLDSQYGRNLTTCLRRHTRRSCPHCPVIPTCLIGHQWTVSAISFHKHGNYQQKCRWRLAYKRLRFL